MRKAVVEAGGGAAESLELEEEVVEEMEGSAGRRLRAVDVDIVVS